MSRRCDIQAPTATAPLRAIHDVPLLVGATANLAMNNCWPRKMSGEAPSSPMRLYMSRTQPQLHSSLLTPVAKVQPMKRAAAVAGVGCLPPPPVKKPSIELPLKRPLSLATSKVEDSRPPSPRQLGRCRPASPSIATNPLYRRRSRDVTPSASTVAAGRSCPDDAVVADGRSRLIAPVVVPFDRHQSGVANVAFPTLPTTPLFQPTVAAATAKRDAQTSPRQIPDSGDSTPTQAASGGVSLANWVRCRLARMRRTFSASRVDDATAPKSTTASTSTLSGSVAPTPKRLIGGRKRHASLQRLVQRLASASPVAISASSRKSRSPTANATGAVTNAASPRAVSARVLKLLPDGSRMVRLQRPRGGKFGFFVSRQQSGVYLSRFNDPGMQRRYRSVMSVGDQILEIEGMSTTAMPLNDLHRFISDKRALLIRVRSCYSL